MDANEKVRLLLAYIPFEYDAHIFSVQRLSSVDTGKKNPISFSFSIIIFRKPHTDIQPNSAPHPSENVINVRIQMYGKLPLPNPPFLKIKNQKSPS